MGGGKGGSTTNNISKTEIPPEVLARYNAVNARAEAVAQQPYQRYSTDPNAFVAGLTPTQQAGIQNTNIMAGAAQPYYGAATGFTLAGSQGVMPGQLNTAQYMNPYTQAVVDPTIRALQQQQGQQLAQQQAEAIRSGAFGGERAGLQRALLQGQQGLATAQAIAPLYSQGFTQAQGVAAQQQAQDLAAQQANLARLSGAGTQLANLGQGAQQAGLAGAQAQLQAGQTQQQTEQAAKQSMYNQFMQEQGYPFQVAQFLANIATGTGALSGNTTSGTSTTTGGGGFFSDKRLKENVQKVGETNDGQPIYRYNYKGDPRTQIGLMAQDVEKEHPEAVGLAGGYKTVDYKKATDGAVRKADGGATTDAYSMDAPSQMLDRPVGLGALALPQMVTGAGIPVRSMTPASEIEALRAPKAMGFSPGTLESTRAQRATLGSALAGGNEEKLNMGSGRGYIQSEYDRLGKFLEPYDSQYSSQGGLVGPEGGAFARGGFAFGGGPYGVELTPMQQRQMLQGAPMVSAPAPQKQEDAIAKANQMAGLVGNLNSAYKARPNFLRSAEDVANREREDAYRKAVQEEYLKKNGIKLDETGGGSGPEDLEGGDEFAQGGLAGSRQGFYGNGYVNPQSYISGVLQEQSEAPPPRKLANSAADFAKPQKPQGEGGGLGDIVNAGMKLNSLYKGGEWAAGKLGLGASPTAMSATSTGVIPEAIDLTSGAGLAAGVPEAAAAVVPEAVEAGAAALAPELLTAGLAEGAASALPFLFFLKNGGAVPHRKHYQRAGLVPPEDVAEAGGDTSTDGGDGETVVGRSAPIARPPRSVPTPADAVAPVPAPRAPGVASASRPSIPDIGGLVPEGMKDTLSSENFWVPALAGIGSMLASPNKTLLGAVGSGLVGGTTAYTDLQKQNALQTKQRFELAKDLFKGPIEGDDKKLYWRHVPSGKLVPQEEYERLYSDFVRGSAGTPRSIAPSSETPAVATARGVITEEPPQLVKGAEPPPVPAAAKPEAEAPAPPAAQPQGGQPSAAPVQVEGQPALKNKTQIKNEMLASPQTWTGTPPERNPILLRQQAARLESEIRQLRDKARRIATTMPENTTEGPRLTAEANQLDANRKEMIERSEKILDEAADLAYEDQKTQSAKRTAQVTGRMAVPSTPEVKMPEGMTVAQAETDPDYLGSRIKSNMEKYAELKNRGELDEANKYLAAAEKDRDRLEKIINTEFTTSSETVFRINPQAPVYNVTKPKALPADYKANIDPNTGAVVSKPIGEFVGYPETGGHPVDPQLIGKKAIVKEGTDKKKARSIAQSDEAEKEFVNGAERAQDALATSLKFATAAKVLEAKGANTTKAEMSNLARGLGFEALADQILSAKDETAAFTALKTNVDQAIQQASAAFPRITQNEFAVTKKEATASIDAPFGASYSLAQTQVARALWQNALLSDWEKEKRMNGTTNFNAFRDVWQRAHPKAMFEESAARALGNFKGQDLPKKTEFTEGVVYVMPKNAEKTGVGRAFIDKGLRPGDLFVMNGVNHQEGDLGEPTKVSPAEAYKVHLRAPVLTYGAR